MSGPTLALFAAVAIAAGPADADPGAVVFPGSSHSVASPDGSGARIYYIHHIDRDGGQAHPVFYDDGRGKRTRVATVTRNMDVGWSPDGRRIFLQDNLGSNIADCYVLDRTAKAIRGVSLFKIIQRTPGRPTGAEDPAASHYYVRCDRWRSSHQIAGAVSGHTDSTPSHAFDHRFVYDARTGRVTWLR